MCGLVGFSGKPNSGLLEKMTRCIAHRGPDDSAFIVSSNFSVGYRRLAIIDLSENIYPIENEKQTIEMVFNGEIYNYQDLRKELEELGHSFKTKSDGETIVHGYEEWGEKVVEKLRGMFVIVLLDKTKNELFISRDRLGIKPLYYSKHEGRIVFGSEIKALFEGFDIPRKPNDKVMFKFLNSRVHDDTEDTFFEHVKRLMPGSSMLVKADGTFEIKKYWNPTFSKEFSSKKSDDEYAAEFKDIFSEAVKLHLLADVPVGVTLSGGLDSSGIASLGKKLFDESLTLAQSTEGRTGEIIAFSAVHPGEKINEEEYIDSVVNATKIRSVKIQTNVEKFWDELENWVFFQEEPVISTAPYAYYVVMREARKKVTVLLSGQGGDELLAGYLPYFFTYLQSAMDSKKFWNIFREGWMGKDLYFKFFVEKLMQKFKSENRINFREMLNTNEEGFKEYEATYNPEYSRNLNERLFTDVTSTTTPSLLRYEDKNSMAHSLESRVPFFDHKVVEYIFNLPMDQKIKFGWTRFIYRNAMKGVIPEKNRLRRSKVGFTNPEWEWIDRKADKFREVFNSNKFKSRKYWNAKVVWEQFELALNGVKTGDVLFFWRLFICEMWMRVYVDKD